MIKELAAFHPISMAITPYETYLDATIDPLSYFNHNINKLDAITIQDYHIPMQTYTVEDHMLHISNYQASKEEIDRAKQLSHDKPFKDVQLDYIVEIDKLLHGKMTKLIHIEHSDLFAKWERPL